MVTSEVKTELCTETPILETDEIVKPVIVLPSIVKKKPKTLRLPKIVSKSLNPDPDRYGKAYIKALHVAKFGKEIPKLWREYFNQEITPAFIFSYNTHTPICLNTPRSCSHKRRDDDKVQKDQSIRKHIFKNVKVHDFLDLN